MGIQPGSNHWLASHFQRAILSHCTKISLKNLGSFVSKFEVAINAYFNRFRHTYMYVSIVFHRNKKTGVHVHQLLCMPVRVDTA